MPKSSQIFLCGLILLASADFLPGQANRTAYQDELANGNMEQSAGDQPSGWMTATPVPGTTIKISTDNPGEGNQSVLINTLESSESGQKMKANLTQFLNAMSWRGKRVRFRASVRGAELESDAKAQLWFRVDRKPKDGKPAFGAFDNMMERPIRGTEWDQYDIVLEIDEDAEKLVVGMFVIGKGKFWVDDVSLEIVDENTPTTGRRIGETKNNPTSEKSEEDKNKSAKKNSAASSRFQMPEAVQKAWAEAEDAPQQPFFNNWMWLALVVVILFALSAWPAREVEYANRQGQIISKSTLGFAPKFALRFSVAYWLLYSLPTPLNRLTMQLGKDISLWSQKVFTWYSQQTNSVVNWVAENIFRIEGELVPPNGSGDTTFNYIQVFTIFVLALMVATAWSAVDWRKTDHRHVKDLLRSYLRYVLAVTMLGYGLAKLGWDSNQFPGLSSFRLDKTWGESSPMGVLWSFMGTSRPYTFFAGLGEVVGGLLLLFRLTTLLGAVVVFGVMLNVMMLNYCYDVPVKLYSTHLVCMSLYLMLPDLGRVTKLLFLNQSTSARDLKPPYVNNTTIWIQRVFKCALIVILFGFPIYQHVQRQVEYFADKANAPNYLGTFDVVEFELNDKLFESSTATTSKWKSVKFERLAYNRQMQRVRSNWIVITLDQGALSTTFDEKDNSLILEEHQSQSIPKGRIDRVEIDEDSMVLSGEIPAGKIKVKLKRQAVNKYRLTGRGFRWINEVPFNR